jgi:hypothetical protein
MKKRSNKEAMMYAIIYAVISVIIPPLIGWKLGNLKMPDGYIYRSINK